MDTRAGRPGKGRPPERLEAEPGKEIAMPEETQMVRENTVDAFGASDDPFATGEADPGTALISAGIHMGTCPAGLAVGELRRRYADAYEIDPDAVALVNGSEADDSTIVREGQSLTFITRIGEKGAVHSW